MKNLVLYGAADRYNYGDNLMPILFSMYVERHHPVLFSEYNILVSAINDSDLSKYSCAPTVSIKKLFKRLPKGSVIVVVGGEVVGSSTMRLFMHPQKSQIKNRLLAFLARKTGRMGVSIALWLAGTGQEYPYVISKEKFSVKPIICFSTVGGNISTQQDWSRSALIERLETAEYVSVRDRRIIDSVGKNVPKIRLFPDSVSIIRELITDDFLQDNISSGLSSQLNYPYFVFQAAPHKIGADAATTSEYLIAAKEASGTSFLLLLIGYASGHDDQDFLNDVSQRTGFPILNDLNLWEIMWVIKNSNAYFGTSLHGAITALAYELPHIGLGNVPKLSAYLSEWSEAPFSRTHSINDIPDLSQSIRSIDERTLERIATRSCEGARENYEALLSAIELESGDEG